MCGCHRVMVKLMRLDIKEPIVYHSKSRRRLMNENNFYKNRIIHFQKKK